MNYVLELAVWQSPVLDRKGLPHIGGKSGHPDLVGMLSDLCYWFPSGR